VAARRPDAPERDRAGIQLEDYLADTVTVPAGTLESSEVDFTLPPALEDPPPGSVYTGDYVPPSGG
jgi:hypothetical protein